MTPYLASPARWQEGPVQISVWDSTSEAWYMVLPVRPAGTGALGADRLAELVTRNDLIGTALV
jgi:nitrile hydratase subunit alpha